MGLPIFASVNYRDRKSFYKKILRTRLFYSTNISFCPGLLAGYEKSVRSTLKIAGSFSRMDIEDGYKKLDAKIKTNCSQKFFFINPDFCISNLPEFIQRMHG